MEKNLGGKRTGAGRPHGSLSLKRKAEKHAKVALDALAAVSCDPAAPHAVRVQAATALLNCGQGYAPLKAEERSDA